MRVGVTGASGFIGSALRVALVERGDEVVSFVRPGASRAPATVRWDPAGGDVDQGDLRRAGPLDAVVNLAGAGIGDRRWSSERQREILESRVNATRLLVRALRDHAHPVPFLASGSAVGYYGSRGDEVLVESSSPGEDFLAQVCRAWEGEATALRESGAQVALLRSGIVAGATGGAFKRQLLLFRAGLGGRLGSGTQWVSPISLVDEVRAILFLLDRRLDGPVNVVAPCALTNRDLTTALARAVRRPALVPVPAFALRLALGAKLTDVAVLASQRVAPHVLTEAGFTFRHADVDAVVRSALADPR